MDRSFFSRKVTGGMNKIHDVTGVILAGGKSSRYGRNKALAQVKGTPLIEIVAGVMGSVFEDVVISTNSPHEYARLRLPMYEDLTKGLGPLGGIYTALKVIAHDAGFFVGCDMPCLNRALIRHMVMCREGFDVVVPRVSWKMEALHALYTKACLSAAERLIDSGNYQVFRFFPEVRVRHIDEEELRLFDPELKSFFNINRPEEMEAYEKDEGRDRGGME
jgi:molybdopterin-guanine dinucleotide biosynthesis protein A